MFIMRRTCCISLAEIEATKAARIRDVIRAAKAQRSRTERRLQD